MRAGRAVRADGREPPVRRADRCAPRPLELHRPREDRPVRRGPRGALRVPPRLPREPARARLWVRAVGPPHLEGVRADRLRARRDRPRLPGQAGAAVLVLLRVQRLQQHARGRLGDDPARLRRGRRRRRAAGGSPGRGRIQLARGRGAGLVGRRQAPDRRRHASGRVPRGRVPREQVHRGALHRQLGGRRRRLRRHTGAARRAPAGGADDPERSAGGERRVSVDHVRGPVGRAAEGVLQRPDRAEPEGSVDCADRVGGGVARPQLRGSHGRPAGHGGDGPLLLRGRAGLRGPYPADPQPWPHPPVSHRAPRAGRVGDRAGDVDAGRAAARRTPPDVGPDPVGVRADVRRSDRGCSSGSASC